MSCDSTKRRLPMLTYQLSVKQLGGASSLYGRWGAKRVSCYLCPSADINYKRAIKAHRYKVSYYKAFISY